MEANSNAPLEWWLLLRPLLSGSVCLHAWESKAWLELTNDLGTALVLSGDQLALVQGVTISNDGATIMKLLDIVHPAAKTLVDISMSQDAEACAFIASRLQHQAYLCLLYRLGRFSTCVQFASYLILLPIETLTKNMSCELSLLVDPPRNPCAG